MKAYHIFAVVGVAVLSSCTVVRQGEVGVKRNLGKVSPMPLSEGPRGFNPFTSTIIKMPTRTVNLEVKLDLPSKEGLTIGSDISILYRIKPAMAPEILQKIGLGYEDEVILPVFRSAAADITSKFYAKDMHSGERAAIEKAVKDQMMAILESRGFVIENVLMKSIRLPQGLAQTVEQKLQAEQDAQRMEFVKEREQRDAERRVIQAEGEKNAQIIAAEGRKRMMEIEAEGKANAMKIEADAQMKANEMINKSLTPAVLKYKSIDAYRQVSTSSNAKLVITDGKTTPLLGMPERD
ncbi:MAG: SPFH domain-containing protein [Cytophagales bacterium]|nr:SPFH domain-containing protein [Cytophagales bacterium]